MKYNIKQLRQDFPDDKTCLDYIFTQKHPNLQDTYYKVKGRKCYANQEGHQIHPLAGTIFHKSSTPLTLWFYAIYLFSQSKNGVSAKELERQLGVTYKCAWRIAKQIRSLMAQGGDMLTGTVEVDETYIGGKDKMEDGRKNKSAIMGMVERGGTIKAVVIPNRETHILLNHIKENISKDAVVMSDEYAAYKKLSKFGYESKRIKHGKKHWVRGNVHTNTIEGFWGQLKRSIRGTYHSVSKKHLQTYVDEFAFRYSHRDVQIFQKLIERV